MYLSLYLVDCTSIQISILKLSHKDYNTTYSACKSSTLNSHSFTNIICCLFFRSSVNKRCALSKNFICDTICKFSNEVKSLGVMISSSMKTTIDVKRQTRTFYARANLLIRNFIHGTDKVKCYMFQSYCTSMYCISCGLTQQNIVCAS